MKKYKLIPFVCGAGASTAGTELAAIDLKNNGLLEHLVSAGVDASWQTDPEEIYSKDWGELAHKSLGPLGSIERKALVLKHCTDLRDQVQAVTEQGCIPVAIGGDHSIAAGSIAGFVRANKAHGRVGVLWIDAHPDVHTYETSCSKACHGTPVSALIGLDKGDLSSLAGGKAALKPEHIYYIGIRDIDEAEKQHIKSHNIRSFTMEEICKVGLEQALETAVSYLAEHTDHLFMTFDIDVLEPSEVPATGTPVEGGIKSKELLPILRSILNRYNFEGLEIAEYNPALQGKEQTRDTVIAILEALMIKDQTLASITALA